MTLAVPQLAMPDGVEARVWPVMLPHGRAQALVNTAKCSQVDFGAMSLVHLTHFWAFRLVARSGKVEQVVEFVLRLPLQGMPEGRAAAIMANMINSSEKFMRYLALLLSQDPSGPGTKLLGSSGSMGASGNSGGAGGGTTVLLEPLVRAFSRNPGQLERIEALMADLKKGATANVIPAGFDDIWRAFRPVKK